MNTFLDNSSIHKLVYTHTDGRLGNIKDDSGTSVIMLEGHTLVDGGVSEDVDVVSNFDGHEILGKGDGTVVAELLGEHVARSRPLSE